MPRATDLEKMILKSHQCSNCTSSFTKSCDLTRHFDRCHLGIKYFCDKCGMGFGRGYRRDQHFRSCGQPKNFCSKCCVNFNTKYDLNSHMTAEHTEFKYACMICNRPFASLQCLRIHARTCGIKSEAITPRPKHTIKMRVLNNTLKKVLPESTQYWNHKDPPHHTQ